MASSPATKAAPKAPAITKAAAKKELSTNNYIAAVVGVTILVVLVCGLITKGLVGSLIINTKLVSGKVQAKSNLNTKLANIPILLNSYNSLGNTKQLISDSLPITPDFPQIISIIQNLGTASGVSITAIAPSGATSDGVAAAAPVPATATATPAAGGSTAPVPYVFTTTITGPYTQVVSFFKNLELSARPMHVTATQISSSNGTLTIALTVQTYYQGQASITDTTRVVK